MNSWKVGDKAIRKQRICEIIHIDHTTEPTSLTVKMLDTYTEDGTEFSRLSKIPTLPRSMTRRKKKNKNKKRRISGMEGRIRK